MTSRRRFVRLGIVAAAVAGAYGGTALLRRALTPDPVFTPINHIPGFRRVAGGPVSGSATLFAGLEAPSGPSPAILTDVCTALFSDRGSAGTVPVAYFTDYRCVNCREVSPLLGRVDGISVKWHETPVLGEASLVAARAALAARAQGAYAAFHDALMGSPVFPTPRYLRALAAAARIDSEQLLADMSAPFVQDQLEISAALARLFGFPGTPALVIGRTAVLGRIDEEVLLHLVALERQETGPIPCAALDAAAATFR